MSRDTSDFCRHALTEFSFLLDFGFSESHQIGVPHFSIEYAIPGAHTIGVGAFLPRYEYYVSLAHEGNWYPLDELAAATGDIVDLGYDWTWAHSDPNIFKQRISHSSELLRGLLPEFLKDSANQWTRVSSQRSAIATAQRRHEQLKLADSAFADGQWTDAISIYESISELSAVQLKRLSIARRRSNDV